MTAQTKWLKSSYSGCEGNECVEVARRGSRVSVRDSKAPRETLAFSARVLHTFIEGLPKTQHGGSLP
ncbi:DUF397 domain-containing protein [Streptomyces olivaceus]|uniref:DUF397 domain-containing protein n=1 Tax=Streptomyces TaxID=1883 RepID=UPI001CCA4130|nr:MULTISPECIES: DUF397 domain-containing protein [Streptomyces]MBZ6142690.1 DUF397 domain-containing protein [Streptomyces olivaceus]MBZ6170387.1 DUF397 domain-containing protein [Streptomyces olivaceus]MBZ6176764.1 DUF397 domain-containing protein [Streptomyces olivaceus]MBZ6182925.1 DUF397 domain-containing protein [Streptomyces olivaceus]MBZ6260775.1 DUF397 domain-containing protein [Streptomyces olivaceus]